MTNLDHAVLAAVDKLNPNGYGVTIHGEAEVILGKSLSYGAVYVSIEYLEANHWVKVRHVDATPERAGREKMFAEITQNGKAALITERNLRSAPGALKFQPR